MIAVGQLRQWVDSQYLPDGYRLQTFVVVEVRLSQVFRSWWLLMGGELIWETEDIIELESDPVVDPCNPDQPMV